MEDVDIIDCKGRVFCGTKMMAKEKVHFWKGEGWA
jgi:hypothetical protein